MFINKLELQGEHVFRNKLSGFTLPFCSTEETSKKKESEKKKKERGRWPLVGKKIRHFFMLFTIQHFI